MIEKKYLVAYFQLKDHEKSTSAIVADSIVAALKAQNLDVDSFAITPVETYSSDEEIFMASAKAEKESHARPEIVGKYSGEKKISDIVLVVPNWWNSVPMAVFTFFDKTDANGKRLVPVVAHAGDGAEAILNELRNFLPHTDVMPAIALTPDDIKTQDGMAAVTSKVVEELKIK